MASLNFETLTVIVKVATIVILFVHAVSAILFTVTKQMRADKKKVKLFGAFVSQYVGILLLHSLFVPKSPFFIMGFFPVLGVFLMTCCSILGCILDWKRIPNDGKFDSDRPCSD